ncbi:MAG: ABC transporter ATP-binding protein [Bacillota bacterium]
MEPDRLLVVEGLDAGYGFIQALNQINLRVDARSITALVGPNGAGKTTLLKAIMGYVTPTAGQISFCGPPITSSPTHITVGCGLGYVPQGRVVFPQMTVQENLAMGLYLRRHDRALRSRAFDLIYTVFPRLHERRWQPAGTLSGGEQQMLAIGRALMTEPKLVLVDEPSLGLAPNLVDLVFETIAKLRENGTAFLLVEQNAVAALEIADYAYVLDLGRIHLEGPAGKLMQNDEVRQAYLGL